VREHDHCSGGRVIAADAPLWARDHHFAHPSPCNGAWRTPKGFLTRLTTKAGIAKAGRHERWSFTARCACDCLNMLTLMSETNRRQNDRRTVLACRYEALEPRSLVPTASLAQVAPGPCINVRISGRISGEAAEST